MKKRNGLRAVALSICLVLVLFTMTACGQQEKKADATTSLQVVVAGTYVDDTRLSAFADELRAALPAYESETAHIVVTGVSMGDSQADPMTTMAGITKLSAMMASGEVDLLICDTENGARNARSESFLALSELTDLEGISGREIQHTQVNEEGEVTGELLPANGVDVSDNAALRGLLGDEAGAYVIVNTKNQQAAIDAIAVLIAKAGN